MKPPPFSLEPLPPIQPPALMSLGSSGRDFFCACHYIGITRYPTLVRLVFDTFGWDDSFGGSVCKGLRSA